MASTDMYEATAETGTAMEQAVAVFMLHPETFGESVATGYQNPLGGFRRVRTDLVGGIVSRVRDGQCGPVRATGRDLARHLLHAGRSAGVGYGHYDHVHITTLPR